MLTVIAGFAGYSIVNQNAEVAEFLKLKAESISSTLDAKVKEIDQEVARIQGTAIPEGSEISIIGPNGYEKDGGSGWLTISIVDDDKSRNLNVVRISLSASYRVLVKGATGRLEVMKIGFPEVLREPLSKGFFLNPELAFRKRFDHGFTLTTQAVVLSR